jgi:DNA-binding ferritin-like protein (Dps family)
MAKNPLELIIGSLDDKKQWRAYRVRTKALPGAYREAAAGLERYLLHLGPTDDGPGLVAMLTDLVDLLEQSAAAGTPVRDVVGADPVEFAETWMQNYGGGSWIRREQGRLRAAIDDAERGES